MVLNDFMFTVNTLRKEKTFDFKNYGNSSNKIKRVNKDEVDFKGETKINTKILITNLLNSNLVGLV